jgi:hypothetical protein
MRARDIINAASTKQDVPARRLGDTRRYVSRSSREVSIFVSLTAHLKPLPPDQCLRRKAGSAQRWRWKTPRRRIAATKWRDAPRMGRRGPADAACLSECAIL